MVRILYSILLSQCLFGQLEASLKRQREEQTDPVYPIRRPIAAQVSHPVIAAEVSQPTIATPASIFRPYSGPFRLEVRSIVNHLISFFSHHPIVYPNADLLPSTEAHLRTHFPTSGMSEGEVAGIVGRIARYIVIPDELMGFLNVQSLTLAQTTEIAARSGQHVQIVQKSISVWRLLHNQGFEPNRSMPGYQIFKRSAILAYLTSILKNIDESGVSEEEMSTFANLGRVNWGPLRMELMSIIRHMLAYFSDTANPVVYPHENVVNSTEVHIRENFPSCQMSQAGIGSIVRRLLSFVVIPNDLLENLTGRNALTAPQITAIATRLGQTELFVRTTSSIWTRYQRKGYGPYGALPNFQTFTRPALLSYLRGVLETMDSEDKTIEPCVVDGFKVEIGIVMQYLITHHPVSPSPSELLSHIQRERPMSALTLADVSKIITRLNQLEDELTDEHEAAQILAGFTQREQAAEIIASLTETHL